MIQTFAFILVELTVIRIAYWNCRLWVRFVHPPKLCVEEMMYTLYLLLTRNPYILQWISTISRVFGEPSIIMYCTEYSVQCVVSVN